MISLTYQQVRNKCVKVMNKHIELKTDSTKASREMVIDLLGLAALNGCSLNTACDSVQDTATNPAILYQLRQGWLNDLALQEIDGNFSMLVCLDSCFGKNCGEG